MCARKTVHSSNRIPPAVGPYSQAIAWGDLVFCSGILPLSPETGKVSGDTIEEQTRQVLDNMRTLLEDLGLDLGCVLKTTVFLSDMEHFKAFNAVYSEYFASDPPARSTVQVARLPLDVLIEVEAIVGTSGTT